MITTFENYKPIKLTGNVNSLWTWLKAINWMYWFTRLPMILLSAPAAWGVGAFASEHLPFPVNVLAGLGLESLYLGCVTIADQLYEQDRYTTILWWALNIIAVAMSGLINVLFFSGNTFAGVTPEALVHGIPLPALSFGYSLLLHQVTNRNVARDFKVHQEAEQLRMKREKFEADNPYLCDVCGERKPTRKALSNHSRMHKPKA